MPTNYGHLPCPFTKLFRTSDGASGLACWHTLADLHDRGIKHRYFIISADFRQGGFRHFRWGVIAIILHISLFFCKIYGIISAWKTRTEMTCAKLFPAVGWRYSHLRQLQYLAWARFCNCLTLLQDLQEILSHKASRPLRGKVHSDNLGLVTVSRSLV